MKFLKGNWKIDYSGEELLIDKMLLEFPIFSLNDDYLKSIANIIFMKLDSVRNMIDQKAT